jgi:hypothetical protein
VQAVATRTKFAPTNERSCESEGETQVSLAVVRDKRDKVIPADVRFAPFATEFLRRRRPPLRAKRGLSHTAAKKARLLAQLATAGGNKE